MERAFSMIIFPFQGWSFQLSLNFFFVIERCTVNIFFLLSGIPDPFFPLTEETSFLDIYKMYLLPFSKYLLKERYFFFWDISGITAELVELSLIRLFPLNSYFFTHRTKLISVVKIWKKQWRHTNTWLTRTTLKCGWMKKNHWSQILTLAKMRIPPK